MRSSIIRFAISLTAGFAIIAVLGTHVLADRVQLVNGDTLNGQVLSLTDSKLRLKSDVLGEIELNRDKVSAIHFGSAAEVTVIAPAPAAAASAPGPATASPNQAADALIGQLLGKNPGPQPAQPGQTPEDILNQLKTDGLDPGSVGDIRKTFPLLAAPEASKYFNETLGGLMRGNLNVQDVRKDAIKARDLINELKAELGPQADALNPYLGILENFIEETKPAGENAPKANQPQKPGDSAAPESTNDSTK